MVCCLLTVLCVCAWNGFAVPGDEWNRRAGFYAENGEDGIRQTDFSVGEKIGMQMDLAEGYLRESIPKLRGIVTSVLEWAGVDPGYGEALAGICRRAARYAVDKIPNGIDVVWTWLQG